VSCELEGVVLAGGEAVPAEGIVVVVTGEEEAAGPRECDGGDTAQDLVVSEAVNLVVATEVEEAAGGVVGAGAEGVAIGEEGDGVDVGLVAEVCLRALARADVPDLKESEAKRECVLVCVSVTVCMGVKRLPWRWSRKSH
jgi:hypothetical protein